MFESAPYAEDGVGQTEQGVYQAAGLITQPLAQIGDAIVVAGYPIELGGELQPRLIELAPKIQGALNRQTDSLRKQLEQLRSLADPFIPGDEVGWMDTLELRPNFFGFGLNLNALLAKLLQSKQRRRRKR